MCTGTDPNHSHLKWLLFETHTCGGCTLAVSPSYIKTKYAWTLQAFDFHHFKVKQILALAMSVPGQYLYQRWSHDCRNVLLCPSDKKRLIWCLPGTLKKCGQGSFIISHWQVGWHNMSLILSISSKNARSWNDITIFFGSRETAR